MRLTEHTPGIKILATICRQLRAAGQRVLDMACATLSKEMVSYLKRTNPLLLAWSPAPGAYVQASDFDKTKPHGRQFSFGISRDAYSKVNRNFLLELC